MLKLTKVFEGLSLFLGEKGLDSLSLQLNCKLFAGQMCNHDLGSLLRAKVNKMHQVCSASFLMLFICCSDLWLPKDFK